MAEHDEDIDTLEIDDEQDEDPDNQDEGGNDTDDGDVTDDEGDGGEETYSIEIDGEEDEQEETPLIKQLRTELRDAKKEAHELRKGAQPQKVEVGTKPTLESCEWDEDRFEVELEAWKDRSRQAEEQERSQQQQYAARQDQFNRKLSTYQANLARLPLPQEDKDAAHNVVVSTLPTLLQSAIVEYADDPAKVVVALAKHPAKLAKLAAIEDPIAFVIAMKDMERNLKVVNRRRPPAPEADTIQRGSASNVGRDKQLEKLEKEADRTGDRTDLIRYKKSLNEKKGK